MDDNIKKLLIAVSNNLKNKNYDEAIKNLKKILDIDNKHLSALSTIADLYAIKKDYAKSIKFFNAIIDINPELSFIYNNKGYCLLNLGLFSESIKCFEKATTLKRDYAEAYNNLGVVYNKIKDLENAKQNFNKAIILKDNYIEAINNLIKVDLALNNLDSAQKNCEKILSINPNLNEINNHLGIIYKRKYDLEKSKEFFKKAIDKKPNFVQGIVNLANIYSETKDFEIAEDYFKKAYKLDTKNPNIISNYLHLKLQTCNWDNLENLIKEFFIIGNNYNKEISPYIALLLNDDGNLLKKISTNWSFRKNNLKQEKFNNKKNSKIKIAYFSSDFKNHPVISLIKNTFKNHDKAKFELFGFNLSKKNLKKNISLDITQNFEKFIDCGNLSDNEIKEQCRNLNLDIIVDLNIHTKDGRPEIFKQRCAPIQINFLGYPGTSGDTCFDYIIGDKIVTPENHHKFYTEKILQMPNSFFPNSFDNFEYNKNITKLDLGIPSDKFIYSCFNNIVKFNPQIFSIWSKILNKAENSILLLSARPKSVQSKNILSEFQKRGISNDRIFFSTKLDYTDYLTRFSLCDIFLDTFPYGAHTTALEALFANLPVLTLRGNAFQSRVASSFLNNLNLDELIADDINEYTTIALKVYQNESYLKNIKQKLDKNKSSSKLFDNINYTKNLEKIYSDIYNDELC